MKTAGVVEIQMTGQQGESAADVLGEMEEMLRSGSMNRIDVIASRVAVKFDTKKELETYRREHKPKPGTKLELRNERELQDRYEDRKRHGVNTVAGDANMDYDQAMRTLRQNLRMLDKQLTKHEMRQKQNPSDYGYVGDLGHANEVLQELMRFIG